MKEQSLYRQLLESIGEVEFEEEPTEADKLIAETLRRLKVVKPTSLKDFLNKENLL